LSRTLFSFCGAVLLAAFLSGCNKPVSHDPVLVGVAQGHGNAQATATIPEVNPATAIVGKWKLDPDSLVLGLGEGERDPTLSAKKPQIVEALKKKLSSSTMTFNADKTYSSDSTEPGDLSENGKYVITDRQITLFPAQPIAGARPILKLAPDGSKILYHVSDQDRTVDLNLVKVG